MSPKQRQTNQSKTNTNKPKQTKRKSSRGAGKALIPFLGGADHEEALSSKVTSSIAVRLCRRCFTCMCRGVRVDALRAAMMCLIDVPCGTSFGRSMAGSCVLRRRAWGFMGSNMRSAWRARVHGAVLDFVLSLRSSAAQSESGVVRALSLFIVSVHTFG